MGRVSINNISKVYPGDNGGTVTAVKDLSLDVENLELVVLVGPSGSGKSTILRLIAGLEEVSQGDIYIGEKRMTDVAAKDRDVAMVFQTRALYPHMSVFDNLAFGLKLRKFSKAEIKRRVAETATILGIEGLLDRKPGMLTAVEQQRVAVGRAIVRQPKVLLFDEPLSRLAPGNRMQLGSEIIKLHQRLQATTIYVAHDPLEAMTMGDRIVVLDEGVVQQVDRPSVLFNNPTNLFVAGFFGSPAMNFVSGTLKADGDKIRFREAEGGTIEVRFAAADRSGVQPFIGKNVILGVRPEDLEIATSSRKEGQAAGIGFPAIVDLVEPLGAEANLYLQTGAHNLICRSRNALDRREAGRRMQFQMNPVKVHFFDPETTLLLG